MLDIKLFRENPEAIKTSQKKRGKDEKLVDKVLELDQVWRELLQRAEELKRERNTVSEKINQMKKESKAATAEIKKVKNIADDTRAAELSGARFYYLKNELVKLNLALIHFAFDNLIDKGYTPMWTPYLLRHRPIEAAAELEDFKDQLYKIEGEELYLIATAEQTLAAFHMDEVLDGNKLPLKYVGFSTNFRKEAGSHGKDTKGIFRVHQFDKVEQFIFCKPESSNVIHEDMVKVTEELFQKLGLPYRVISIPAQDLNDNAAKKYDIEVWFPAQRQYRELISVSNCT